MAIRQRGTGYQVDVSINGTRAPRVTVPTRAEAETLEAQFRADLLAGREIKLQGSKIAAARTSVGTIRGLFEFTMRHVWKGTKNEYKAEINARQWVEALGDDFLVANLTEEEIAKVCDRWSDRGNSAATINRKLSALSKMLRIAIQKGEITRIPILPKKKEYAGRIRWYSKTEEESLLEFFKDDQDMYDLIVIGLDTGFREGEILSLEARDYIPETNLLHVWETKSDSPRSVPLTFRAKDIIQRRSRNTNGKLWSDVWKAKRISDRMRTWRFYSGLEKDKEAVFHVLRHTCCSRLVQAGVHLTTVQKWMGHKDIKTTLRYAHLAPNAFNDALEALNG